MQMKFFAKQLDTKKLIDNFCVFSFAIFTFLLLAFFAEGCSNGKMQVSSLNSGVVDAPKIEKTSSNNDEFVVEGTCDTNAQDLEIKIEDQVWSHGEEWISAKNIAGSDSDLQCEDDGKFKILTNKKTLEEQGIKFSEGVLEIPCQIRQEFLDGHYSNPESFILKLDKEEEISANTENTETKETREIDNESKFYFVDGVLPVSFINQSDNNQGNPLGFLPMSYSKEDWDLLADIKYILIKDPLLQNN